jgi:predicted ATP-binding protein involved in virulence
MKILGLTLKNFRGIDDLTLDFSDSQTTVLVGVNGAGKSSILDAIATLLNEELESLFRKLSESETSNLNSAFQSRPYWHSMRTDIKAGAEEYLLRLTLNVLGNEGDWTRRMKSPSRKSWEGTYIGSQHFANKIFELLDQKADLNVPIMVYYPVNRRVTAIDLPSPNLYEFHQLMAYANAISSKIEFEAFFEWFRAREDLENEQLRADPRYRDIQLEAVRNAVYKLLPRFSDLKVQREMIPAMMVKKGGNELNILQLSDGEKCTLAMVGDIARRLAIANPSLADPLLGEGVVLIDEIDLHLHPSWQRKIIPGLERTFPNLQFIVATHSPQVLSSAKDAVVYLLLVIDGVIKAKKFRGPYGKDTNMILETLMDVDERPLEIKEKIAQYFDSIDDDNFELAERLRQELAEDIGEDDPELQRGQVRVKRKKFLRDEIHQQRP